MRRLYLMVLAFALPSGLSAQEETLFADSAEAGGFGGPVLKATTICNQSSLILGGRGGWIIGHSLILGGGGYGSVTELDAPAGVLPAEGPLDIKFGYGGIEIEYVHHPNELLHMSVYALLGGGTVNFTRDVGPLSQSDQVTGISDFVYVFEPAVQAELNVTTWFRLNAGVSYRQVFDVDQPLLKDSDFSGLSGVVTFKFGDF